MTHGVKPYKGLDQFFYVCEPNFVSLGKCPDEQVIQMFISF